MSYKRTLVTCALPYANGPVHIGHLAGAYIPGDIYVRYLRMRGEDVVFVCGSDEHGVPITIKARKEGVTPQDIVDRYHKVMKDAFTGLGINFDIYSRTSSAVHEKNASEFFRKLYDQDNFITQESEQLYDEEARMFLTDRLIEGTCPKCGNPHAYGDQCEKCGSTLSPEELIDPKSKLSGSTPVKKKTKHWYLPLDQYEPWLRDWILEQHKEWKTNVYGQCKSWLDGGLQPRAVTRDLDWGVPVPVEGAEGKVLYVWFDAPIGYISNTQELLPQSWEKWWKDPETKLVHFIGKDNIVFHCIIFPCMLKADGSYILPDNVPANEFLNLEGDKISTSRNWAVWAHEYLQDFPGKQDVLRYTLTAIAPETKDADFTWADYQARNNNELLAIFGNFVNRTVVLTHKYYGGIVPAPGEYSDYEKEIVAKMAEFPKTIGDSIEHYRFREALQEFMNLARIGNKYLTDTEPWKKQKEDPEAVKTILHLSLQICAALSVLCEPFLPFTAKKLQHILNIDNKNWQDGGRADLLQVGAQLNPAEYLFEKIEDAVIARQIQKLEDTKKANEIATAEAVAAKEDITFEEFQKMDLRVVTVLEAEKVAKTKKLLKLKVNTGVDVREIVSGIAEYYEPQDLVGKQVLMLINLAPKNIKGVESHGMVLMAEHADGTLSLMQPQKAVKEGSTVK